MGALLHCTAADVAASDASYVRDILRFTCVILALIRSALCDCLESTRYSCPRRHIRSSFSHSLLQHYNPLTGQGYGAKGLGMSTLVCDWLQRVQ